MVGQGPVAGEIIDDHEKKGKRESGRYTVVENPVWENVRLWYNGCSKSPVENEEQG